MDRQTDRILIARPRLHSMQRGKNRLTLWPAAYCRPITDQHPTPARGMFIIIIRSRQTLHTSIFS